jgi:DNA-binding transcriptional LysR family regulator
MAELSLDDLAMFVRVLERGGFSSAARLLGVPTSNVSRAVARLESQSGVQLLHRTTRTVKATSEGQELFASVATAMTTLRGAVRTIEPAARKPKGRLRVTAPRRACSSPASLAASSSVMTTCWPRT